MRNFGNLYNIVNASDVSASSSTCIEDHPRYVVHVLLGRERGLPTIEILLW